MLSKFRVLLGCALIGVMTLAGWNTVQARELPVATGEHWTNATEAEKKAFLFGTLTMVQVVNDLQVKDAAARKPGHKPTPPPTSVKVVSTMTNGLSQYSISQLIEEIDKWYSTHPDQLKRPLLEVIWFEFAVPNAATK
jgi:hypothetical protein